MPAEKDVIRYCKTYFEGAKEKEFECDVVVPDSEADICQVIMAEQQNYLSDVMLANGKITVRGKCAVNALCRPEQGDEAVFIKHLFDFEQVFDTDNVPNDAKVNVTLENGYVSCKILNSRKLGIRAMSKVKVTAAGNAETEIFTGKDTVETLSKQCGYATVIGFDERTVKVSEDIEIDSALPAIRKILFTKARAYCADRKIINNRVIVKGILETATYYAAQDGTYRTASAEIPFNHIFNIDGVDENCVCVVNMNVKSVSSEVYNNTESENRVIETEVELYFSANAYAEKTAVICKDAFSTEKVTEAEKTVLSLYGKPYEAIGSADFKEQVKFESTVLSVCSVCGEATVSRTESENGVLFVRGDILISAIGTTEGGVLECSESKLPFEIRTDACDSGCKCIQANAVITNLTHSAASANALEVKGSIKVYLQYCPCINEDAVCELKDTGRQRQVSDDMILYYPEGNEKYWDIAKKYGIGVGALKSINGCDGDVCTETMIIIPKM